MALEWLDPEQADTLGLVTLGFVLMVVTLAISYVVAFLWHRYRDKRSSD